MPCAVDNAVQCSPNSLSAWLAVCVTSWLNTCLPGLLPAPPARLRARLPGCWLPGWRLAAWLPASRPAGVKESPARGASLLHGSQAHPSPARRGARCGGASVTRAGGSSGRRGRRAGAGLPKASACCGGGVGGGGGRCGCCCCCCGGGGGGAAPCHTASCGAWRARAGSCCRKGRVLLQLHCCAARLPGRRPGRRPGEARCRPGRARRCRCSARCAPGLG